MLPIMVLSEERELESWGAVPHPPGLCRSRAGPGACEQGQQTNPSSFSSSTCSGTQLWAVRRRSGEICSGSFQKVRLQ